MFNKLVDVLKEVFWLKKSKPKRRASASRKKTARKATVRKTARKKPAKPVNKPVKAVKPPKPVKPPKVPQIPKIPKAVKPLYDPSLNQVGEVTHYFDRIKVCVVKITQGTILIGDRLTFASKTHAFVQKVWSMQIESQDVKVAKKGQLIGLKVDKAVNPGDIVLK